MIDDNERLAEAVRILIDYLLENVPPALLAGQTINDPEPNGKSFTDHRESEVKISDLFRDSVVTVESDWNRTDQARSDQWQTSRDLS